MPSPEALEKLVSERASQYARKMLAVAARSGTEEDIRIESERQLALIQDEAGITLDGRHEFTVASGRADSVYDRVVIEYKNPHSSSDRIGSTLEASGTRKVVEQIKSRFGDLAAEYGHPINSLLGVGLDGRRFVFVRFRDKQWQIQPPVEVDQRSAQRFIWALFNLGKRGKPFAPEHLSDDFGAGSEQAQKGIRALYDAICATSDSRAQVLFAQWRILFSEVCGYNVDDPSDKMIRLGESYGIDQVGLKPAELLFALHSYYGLFMKLLAAEIVAFFHKLTSPLQKLIRANTSARLRTELADLEEGGVFRHFNITNFLEGDLFAWYISAWSEDIDYMIRRVTLKLDEYNPGTLSEDPLESRDLLKKLYHQLFPRSVRHDLGEYYTPDWLAEHILEELKFDGDPRRRILDPACGSGTFLVFAINRIRKWHEDNRESSGISDRELCSLILQNVVGFDLNPLAVMAARTNYLIAIRDLLSYVDRIEIPVYLCDSVVTPAEYGSLFTGGGSVAKVPCSAVKPPYLMVPKEIATNSEHVAAYARLLEHAVRVRLPADDFVRSCRDESLPMAEEVRHRELYAELTELETANKNGLWARIIKNAFAPLFAGKFDFIAGNPPWVNWESLPADYRSISDPIWREYGLVGPVPGKRRQQSEHAKTDVSILMTYVAIDKLLCDGGKLGFVITRSVFQAELGGWHFRSFKLPDGIRFAVLKVFDLDPIKPFRGQAVNVTCTFFAQKSKRTSFPVRWNCCVPAEGTPISEDSLYANVWPSVTLRKWVAVPIDPNQPQSPWLFGESESIAILRGVLSRSFYATFAREGANTRGANGVYFVEAWERNRKLFVRNLRGEGDDQSIPEVEQSIEPRYVYCLLRGRDVSRWVASSSGFIVMPHDEVRPTIPVAFGDLPPKTREYLSAFREKLQSRRQFRNFDPSGDDWYGLYSVLEATFAPFKVVWREMASGTIAAIVPPGDLPTGQRTVVIP